MHICNFKSLAYMVLKIWEVSKTWCYKDNRWTCPKQYALPTSSKNVVILHGTLRLKDLTGGEEGWCREKIVAVTRHLIFTWTKILSWKKNNKQTKTRSIIVGHIYITKRSIITFINSDIPIKPVKKYIYKYHRLHLVSSYINSSLSQP